MLLIDTQAVYRLVNVLSGFAANATACGACRMGNQSATEALAHFERVTGISRQDAYLGAKRATAEDSPPKELGQCRSEHDVGFTEYHPVRCSMPDGHSGDHRCGSVTWF